MTTIYGVSDAAAAMAFGLRQLTTAYNGPLFLVLRSSDNNTMDIGFLPNGLLDTATLLSFVGSGNGSIITWYDQTVNGRHFELLNQNGPLIVINGALQTLFGQPALRFPNNSQFLMVASYNFGISPFTVTCSMSKDDSGNYYWLTAAMTSGSPMALGWTQTGGDLDLQQYGSSDTPSNLAFSNNQGHILTWASTTGYTPGGTASAAAYLDTTSTSGFLNLSYANNTLQGGTQLGQFPGYLNEIVYWNTELSDADREVAEQSLALAIGQGNHNAAATQALIMTLTSETANAAATSTNLQVLATENANSIATSINIQALVPVNLGPYVTTRDMASTNTRNGLSLLAFSAKDLLDPLSPPTFNNTWIEDGDDTNTDSRRVVTGGHQNYVFNSTVSEVTATFPHAILAHMTLLNIIISAKI